MALNDSQLWECIRGLESKIVYTIKRRSPNKILRVTDDRVEIESRATRPSREDILCVYQYLHMAGRVTQEDLYGEGSILGHPYARKTGRIIMAILAAAVPDEIGVIPANERLSGIIVRVRG
jgi:hypothetical protein